MIKDDLLVVDIQQDSSWAVINGRGPSCGPQCFLYGMNNVFEAAMLEGVQHSSCGILHLHENIDGPEGEVFIVSYSGSQLDNLTDGLSLDFTFHLNPGTRSETSEGKNHRRSRLVLSESTREQDI
ncbi:hypothetical protein IEQ34_000146 [Dendrobium chrysotoxum]|uniref:Uncharacterized protein n=1 Tax=Dendrobium chrysotoxum TaxID=161865 RepID=A0AAV7HS36_DENCH|nr:hypothetical protein IEQ34_000146 [Dendrobium chrysotoxum]